VEEQALLCGNTTRINDTGIYYFFANRAGKIKIVGAGTIIKYNWERMFDDIVL
jgi:hypothetical protein